MEKVFSVKAFKESCKKRKSDKAETKLYLKNWAKKSEGLTAKEMKEKYGFNTCDEWMVEKE